jgi:hypothetical protein
MSKKVMPPTKAIATAAALIDEAVNRFLAARKTLPELGKYESDVEAVNAFKLVIRHVEAVCTLAKEDLASLPSALAIARSAFETTARILWMLRPDDVFEREARYLAHLGGEEDFFRRLAGLFGQLGLDGGSLRGVESQIRALRTGVERVLPAGVKALSGLPTFRAMLKDIGEESYYAKYMLLSQYAHGTHVAGGVFRQNLGSRKKLGEFIYPESWDEPLKAAWWCLATGGLRILGRLGGKPESFLDHAFLQKATEALKNV